MRKGVEVINVKEKEEDEDDVNMKDEDVVGGKFRAYGSARGSKLPRVWWACRAQQLKGSLRDNSLALNRIAVSRRNRRKMDKITSSM